jgi:mono/diheme cytochrome c family protein
MRLAAFSMAVSVAGVLATAAQAAEARLAGARQAEDPAFDSSVKPFLTRTCAACHNPQLKSGGLDLSAYPTAAALAQDPQIWEKVVLKLRTGQMPPPPMPHPAEVDVQAITRWIEDELGRADAAAPPDPGRVTARRLNRTEYDHTVRDLLGVDLRPAEDFPQDDSGYGFDNIGDVLSLSPVLMEKYLAAAERISQAALFGPAEGKPTLVRVQPPGGKVQPSPTPLLDYDLSGLSLPNALHAIHRFPVDGEYVFRVVVGGERPAGSEPLRVGLWIDGQQVEVQSLDPEGLASFSQDRQDFSGQNREFRARVAAGDRWVAGSIVRLFEGLPPSYEGPSPSKRPIPPPREFKPPPDLPAEKLEKIRLEFEARAKEKVPANAARVSRIEIVGPYAAAKGPSAESLRLVYTCGHLRGGHGRGCARKIVANLARRAYRRPVAPSDVDPIVRLVDGARKRGDSFEQAIGLAIQAILVSPDFLFRIERDARLASARQSEDPRKAGDLAHPISQHELASRLSYFLWASMPD